MGEILCVLKENEVCPRKCPLRPYSLDLQDYRVIVHASADGKYVELRRKDLADEGSSVSTRRATHSIKGMLEDCLNYPLLIASLS